MSSLLAALLGLGLALAPQNAPQNASLPPSGLEGPLGNDSYVPANLTAEELFLAGRAQLAEDRTAGFETLRAALAASAPGDGLPALDGRTTLGVEAAVGDLLASLPPGDVRAWCERFEDLAEETRRTDPAGAERRFPGTRAALRAGLLAVDRALEHGRPAAAHTGLARLAAHLELRAIGGFQGAFEDAIAQAVARRTAVLATLERPAAPTASHTITGPFDSAARLPRPRTVPFEFELPDEDPYLADLLGRQSRRSNDRGPGLGVRPGLVALGADRVLVQTAIGLHLIDLALGQRVAVIEPRRLADQAFGRINTPTAARQGGAPGWSHHPLTTDDLVLLVTGRTGYGASPNALVALERASLTSAPAIGDGTTLEPLPTRARWLLSGTTHVFEDEGAAPAALEELDGAEIQPGPVLVDDRLLFQARVLDGEVKSYLVCLDARTGAPLWTRLVTKGGAIDDGSRFGQSRLPLGSAAPLASAQGRVLVSTNLGVDALYDVADGRLVWAFKTRRVQADDARFSGLAPLVGPDAAFVATAPADGDHVYLYRPGPAQAGSPLFAAPLPRAGATDLVGFAGDALFVLEKAGGEHLLATRPLPDSDASSARSILLRRDERFVAPPAIGAERLVISSNRGVFLFDRTRGLYLADHVALPGGAGPREAGGEVFALDERLLVLGPGTLWILDAP